MPGENTALQTGQKLEYIVMPDFGEGSPPSQGPSLTNQPPSKRRRKILLIILAMLIFLGLSAAAYYYFARQASPKAQAPTPAIVVENAKLNSSDSDLDGLSDDEEDSLGTKPDRPDSDSDGLSDGDEVHIYASGPLQIDTDGDSFPDGQEVARGFSPSTSGFEPASPQERQSWLVNSVKFGIHEPTKTTVETLGGTEARAPVSATRLAYVNGFYNYSIEYSPEFTVRDESGGQIAAISVDGAEPADDPTLEPIVIALGGTKEALTLKEWVESQYSSADYVIEELSVNGLPAVKIHGLPGEDGCGQDKTFFAKNNLILSITWNCNTLEPLRPYYQDIINSFKFT